MENQGTPIGSTQRGMKNTTDPRAKQPIQESAGPVASDSLAAESYNAGERFHENRNAAPSGQPGASSTLNNEDTSAARELNPTSTRTKDSYEGEGQSYPEQVGGQPHFSGSTTSQGYTGGPSAGYSSSSSGQNSGSTGTSSGSKTSQSRNADSSDIGGSSTSGEDRTFSPKTTRSGSTYGGDSNTSSSNTDSNASTSHVDKAPNYIADVYLADTNKPKGKNIKEDENLDGKRIDEGDYEIGSKNDPGRAALQDFEKSNARISTGQAGTQREIDGENAYSELQDERA